MASHGRRSRRHAAAHDNDDRWLLTYADMITLLMALFMVLFSISSVNISKYQTLQQSLKAAFSGSILPGGKAVLKAGSVSTSAHSPATANVIAVTPTRVANTQAAVLRQLQQQQLQQLQQNARDTTAPSASVNAFLNNSIAQSAAGIKEQADFLALKAKLDAYATKHGMATRVQTLITRNGLVIRVLTDKVLFASGQADLQPEAAPLLGIIAQLLNVDRTHPITVAGHTDNQPISTAQFPSNWELSAARATTVLHYLIDHGVNPHRVSAAGYGAEHPIDTNATDLGRAHNRRVEIILQRQEPYPAP